MVGFKATTLQTVINSAFYSSMTFQRDCVVLKINQSSHTTKIWEPERAHQKVSKWLLFSTRTVRPLYVKWVVVESTQHYQDVTALSTFELLFSSLYIHSYVSLIQDPPRRCNIADFFSNAYLSSLRQTQLNIYIVCKKILDFFLNLSTLQV